MNDLKDFDEEYLYLRKMVLSGRTSVGNAKLWIKDKGDRLMNLLPECRIKTTEAQLKRQLDKDYNKMPEE